MAKNKKLSSRPQNRPPLVNAIQRNHDIILGLQNDIEDRLLISHSQIYVNEILGKIDLIIEAATDMGIDFARCKYDQNIKHRLNEARSERNN
ncbi:hypothetical protein MKC54_05140 [[Clostridium] innocuum]|nr:hypothetical protein [[Clostridium] innocuum]MCR0576265.1 hypothetical protein [[Clostridium] innocuum]